MRRSDDEACVAIKIVEHGADAGLVATFIEHYDHSMSSTEVGERAGERPRNVRKPMSRFGALLHLIVTFSLGTSLWLGLQSAYSAFPGAPTGAGYQDAVTAAVTVESCDRSGPISWYGFGYWWTCQVQTTTGGRAVRASVGNSILTDQDVGKQVTLYRACDRSGSSCAIGRNESRWWEILLPLVKIIQLGVAFLTAMLSAAYLLGVVVGDEGFKRMLRGTVGRRRYRQESA